MPIDINQIRKETPHCEDALFFNSAGSSLPSHRVNPIIIDYLEREAIYGGYRFAEMMAEEIQGFYTEVAELINAKPRNIAFAGSATDAYGKLLSAIPFKSGDVIITTNDDYTSNYFQFISLSKRYGVRIIQFENLENGDLDLEKAEALILSEKPVLVALSHIPTSSGLVQDAKAIGSLCKKHNALYLLDACQSVGQMKVDVEDLYCDFLSVTGRKFMRGPRGTGFLYVADKHIDSDFYPMTMDGSDTLWTDKDKYKLGATARRFELWEKSYALVLGFKEAVRYINHVGIENIEAYSAQIMKQLRDNLKQITGVQQFDKGSRTSNILTFRKEGKNLEQIQEVFRQHNVIHSVTLHSHSVIDFSKKEIDYALRISPHYFNSSLEIDKLSEIIESI